MMPSWNRRHTERRRRVALPSPPARTDAMLTYRVRVPDHVRPGEEFQVFAGGRVVRVTCPPDLAGPHWRQLQITVPADDGDEGGRREGDDVNAEADMRRDGNESGGQTGVVEYVVAVPAGVRPGQEFPAVIGDQRVMVRAPLNLRPDMSVVRVTLPDGHDRRSGGIPMDCPPMPRPPRLRPRGPPGAGSSQLYEVEVPPSATPGRPFLLMAGGNRVLVSCPENAAPGQMIRFELPLNQPDEVKGRVPRIRLRYEPERDGWMRIVRTHDRKFQWVRVDRGSVDESGGRVFDVERSAFVRRLALREKTGEPLLGLVPADQGTVDSHVRTDRGDLVVTYTDIAAAQVRSFAEKDDWFRDACERLRVPWEEGHMRVNVRRESLLGDSMDAVLGMGRGNLRKTWRIEFIGEEGIDAGGLLREWFRLVTEAIFDPDRGFWRSSSDNQMHMEINPASEVISPEDHLQYYRFVGRVLGKALFDGQLVAGHLAQYLYKHLLGWPVTFADLRFVDESFYRSLKQLKEMEDECVEDVCQTFTATKDILGTIKEVDLIKGGSNVEVTSDNLSEFFESVVKYKLLGRVAPQLTELLMGFYDVIPQPLLTVFDFQELELLMCGLPKIDMKDWKMHTEYRGLFEESGAGHPACRWFWEVVADFDDEMRARLLQFVTGSSGVPARGFAVLQSQGGNLQKFTLNGMETADRYPHTHTCFNRIDLPCYDTKRELRERLEQAIVHASTVGEGFFNE